MITISASITTNPTATGGPDSSGKTLRSGRVKNDRHSLGGFLERYRANSHAVIEATRNWMVMYDWLDDICDDVVLAHPLKVKAIADAKIKTDKIDATVLAHLLRADRCRRLGHPAKNLGSFASRCANGCFTYDCAR